MKNILTPEAAKAFEPVLKWLDAGGVHVNVGAYKDVGFEMNRVIITGNKHYTPRDQRGETCGTACCIAGALEIFSPEIVGEYQDPMIIGKKLGMKAVQINALFFGYSYREAGNRASKSYNFSDISAEVAATTIRHFLKTGDVVWNIGDVYLEDAE